MAKLEEILNLRSPEQQKHVRDRLATLELSTAIRKQAVKNLWFDPRPPASAWDVMIDAVVSITGLEAAYIEDAIRAAFRRVLLQADPVECGAGTHFGRAVPFDRLADEIYSPPSGSSRPNTPHRARSWLRNVLSHDLGLARKLWRTRKLGRYVMWSTFEAGSADPFGPPPIKGRRIRADLGLPDGRDELVLLVYQLPTHIQARFPTVVEAYASSLWPYYFSPAGPDATCGMTLPRNEGGTGIPRSEVVHTPVDGAMLSRKPERAR